MKIYLCLTQNYAISEGFFQVCWKVFFRFSTCLKHQSFTETRDLLLSFENNFIKEIICEQVSIIWATEFTNLTNTINYTEGRTWDVKKNFNSHKKMFSLNLPKNSFPFFLLPNSNDYVLWNALSNRCFQNFCWFYCLNHKIYHSVHLEYWFSALFETWNRIEDATCVSWNTSTKVILLSATFRKLSRKK